jgi:hypothetical protein
MGADRQQCLICFPGPTVTLAGSAAACGQRGFPVSARFSANAQVTGVKKLIQFE